MKTITIFSQPAARFIQTSLFIIASLFLIAGTSFLSQALTCTEKYTGAGEPNWALVEECEQALLQEQSICNDFAKQGRALSARCESLLNQNEADWTTQYSSGTIEEERQPTSIKAVNQAGVGADGPANSEPSSLSWPTLQELTNEVNQCAESNQSASTCCQNPMKCIDDDSQLSVDNNFLISMSITMGQALPGGSLKDQCQRAKSLNQFGAVANSAMAITCQIQKNRCEESCESPKQKLEVLTQHCQALTSPSHEQLALCESYKQAYKEIDTKLSSCQRFSEQIAMMGAQSLSQAQSAKINELCVAQAKAADANLMANVPSLEMDCSDPAFQSHPHCQPCQDEGSQTNPLCRQTTVGLSNSAASTYNSSSSGFSSENGSYIEEETLPSQSPNFADLPNTMARSKGIKPGSGQGVPSAQPTSPMDTSSPRGNSKSHYKTDTLSGFSSPGSPSVSGMGYSQYQSGNSWNPSAARNIQSQKRLKKFNLKNYVPQVHRPLIERLPAGQTVVDIAPGHSKNIFQKVSDLFYRHCKSGDFYECQHIQKQSISLPRVKGANPPFRTQ